MGWGYTQTSASTLFFAVWQGIRMPRHLRLRKRFRGVKRERWGAAGIFAQSPRVDAVVLLRNRWQPFP